MSPATVSNAEVKAAVTKSDKAIGYVGMNYVEGGALGAVAYESVMPSAETIKDGSYPLSRALDLYTFGDPSPDAKEFIDFILSDEGQKNSGRFGIRSRPLNHQ